MIVVWSAATSSSSITTEMGVLATSRISAAIFCASAAVTFGASGCLVSVIVKFGATRLTAERTVFSGFFIVQASPGCSGVMSSIPSSVVRVAFCGSMVVWISSVSTKVANTDGSVVSSIGKDVVSQNLRLSIVEVFWRVEMMF